MPPSPSPPRAPTPQRFRRLDGTSDGYLVAGFLARTLGFSGFAAALLVGVVMNWFPLPHLGSAADATIQLSGIAAVQSMVAFDNVADLLRRPTYVDVGGHLRPSAPHSALPAIWFYGQWMLGTALLIGAMPMALSSPPIAVVFVGGFIVNLFGLLWHRTNPDRVLGWFAAQLGAKPATRALDAAITTLFARPHRPEAVIALSAPLRGDGTHQLVLAAHIAGVWDASDWLGGNRAELDALATAFRKGQPPPPTTHPALSGVVARMQAVSLWP